MRAARPRGQRWCAHETLWHDDRRGPLQRLRRVHGGLRGGEQRPARPTRERTNAKGSPGFAYSRWITARRIRISAPLYVPMLCQQCGEEAPCAQVCPQQAVDVDPETGIVGQMPERCLGCRYCMAACPYHARYFNWWDPAWPAGMEKTLNPDVAPRHARRGREVQLLPRPPARRPAARRRGRQARYRPGGLLPACAEACPTGAIRFGDLNDHGRSRATLRAVSACWRSWAPNRRSTTGRRRTGCAASQTPRRRPARRTSMDKQLITRGLKRCSTAPIPAVDPALDRAAGLRRVLRRPVPGQRPEPDQHGQPFRLRPLDLSGPYGHRARRGRFFYRLSALHPETSRAASAVINSAVVIGLVCYSGAMAVLTVDVGQPLRAWFTFWYPNVHSMLTEVTFCISCYLTVLLIEYLPIVLKNRKLRDVPGIPGFRIRAAQAGLCAGRRGHVPLVLPPGLARRPVRRAARPAFCLP